MKISTAIVRTAHPKHAGAAILRINRPEVRNALRPEDLSALNIHLLECQYDEDVKVIILTGTGSAFCAGADLKTVNESGARRGMGGSEIASEILYRIVSMSKIVIAAMNGPSAGLGNHIAIVSDLTIARPETEFFFTGPSKGIPSLQMGALVLPMLIGLKRAKELLTRGGRLPAQRALEYGLINSVIEADFWENEIEQLAKEFSERNALVMALDKYQVNQWAYHMGGALRLSSLAGAQRMASMGPVVTGRMNDAEQA